MTNHHPTRWSGKRSVSTVKPKSQPSEPAAPASAPDTGYMMDTQPEPPAAETATGTDAEATDAAVALAAEHNIDLATVQGTGAEGRITKDDVAALIDGG